MPSSPFYRAIAGKRELAARFSLEPLIDDAANRAWEAGRTRAVENDLDDRALPSWLITHLVQGDRGKAVDCLRVFGRSATETVRRGADPRPVSDGDPGVRRTCLRHRHPSTRLCFRCRRDGIEKARNYDDGGHDKNQQQPSLCYTITLQLAAFGAK